MCGTRYGVATISRLLKNIRLFCRISALLWGSFAKETYDLKEPTNRSHPACDIFKKRIFLNHSGYTHIYIKETIYVYTTDVCNIWKDPPDFCSINLHVSFAKEPQKRDDILQKRRIILRRLLIVVIDGKTDHSWIPWDIEIYMIKRRYMNIHENYRVATISRLLKIIPLFCRISSIL